MALRLGLLLGRSALSSRSQEPTIVARRRQGDAYGDDFKQPFVQREGKSLGRRPARRSIPARRSNSFHESAVEQEEGEEERTMARAEHEQWGSFDDVDRGDDEEDDQTYDEDWSGDEEFDNDALTRGTERRRTQKQKRKQAKRLEISEQLLEKREKKAQLRLSLPPEPLTSARASRLINELKLLCGRSSFGNPKSIWSQVALDSLYELLAEIHECLRIFTTEPPPPPESALVLRPADATTVVISLARASIANYSMLEEDERLNQVWDHCLEAVLPRLPPETPKDLANVLWAIAKRQRSQSSGVAASAVDMLAALAVSMTRRCSAQELSNIMWAFGRLEAQLSPDLHEAVCKAIVDRRSAFIPQGVTNVLWAFGRLRQQPSDACLRALLGFAAERHDKYNSQCIANTISALGDLKLPSATAFPVVDALLGKGRKIAGHFNVLELSNTFLGLAELAYPNPDERLTWLYVAVAQKLEFFGGAGLANVLWYQSELLAPFPDPSFTTMLFDRLQTLLPQCTGNEIADITWSLSRIPNVSPSFSSAFLEALNKAILASLPDFDPDERSRCLLGSSALGINIPER